MEKEKKNGFDAQITARRKGGKKRGPAPLEQRAEIGRGRPKDQPRSN